jgi:alpha-tubulin suppressor-like RCC1 family protein
MLENFRFTAGLLGFGLDWCVDCDFAHMRKEEPTLVPAAERVRMRSVANGDTHSLALADDGQVYWWGFPDTTCLDPEIPTLFEAASELRMRRVAAGAYHSAALTDEGRLYTWVHSKHASNYEDKGASGAGYPLCESGDAEIALCRPRRVEGGLAGMRIVSVAAGDKYTIVATDEGAVRLSRRLSLQLGSIHTTSVLRKHSF